MAAWDELKQEVSVELEQLQQFLASHHELFSRCRSKTLDNVELSALAAVLHSFYTGVENIFVRITVRVHGRKFTTSAWHKELLEWMATPAESRGAVISPSLREQLTEYLTFRHVFRPRTHSNCSGRRWSIWF